MKLFNFLRSKSNTRQFVSETTYDKNLDAQMQMIPEALHLLQKLDITSDEYLRLEFFFYTNTAAKAELMVTEMEKLNYTAYHGAAAGNGKLFVVTGWTTKMKMSDEVIKQWTKEMCELGYRFDCEFDGWGTITNQDQLDGDAWRERRVEEGLN